MNNEFQFKDPRKTFWHYLFYLCWSIVTIWAVLKIVGVINTPEWLAFSLPATGIIIGVFSLYKNLVDSLTELRIGLASLKTEFKSLANRVEVIENK